MSIFLKKNEFVYVNITYAIFRLIPEYLASYNMIEVLFKYLTDSNIYISHLRYLLQNLNLAMFVDRCLSFCPFPIGHCVVCPSSINDL